jgi:hypothetical protein
MSSFPVNVDETAPTEIQPKRTADERRIRWFDVFLVLLVACGSSFLNSLHLFKNGPTAIAHVSNARWSIGILQEVTALLLLGYILSRRNLRFGLRWSLRDVGVGLVITGMT